MSYETNPLRETIRTAIGYELVPLSIRDHPEITREFRTAEDADGLVDRIEEALRAAGYIRMNALIAPTEDDEGPTEYPPTDGEVEEIYIRHLLGGIYSTEDLRLRFQAWLQAHDERIRKKERQSHVVELSADQVASVRNFLEKPNGSFNLGLPARIVFEAVQGGGALVRTCPYGFFS